jgi:hypothetical protein
MPNPNRFREVYDYLPTADDKRLFLAGFVGAISNHISSEDLNHCIDVALKVSGKSAAVSERESA